MLCAERPGGPAAWEAFRSHAESYHDTFVLAALLTAHVVCDVAHGGVAPAEAMAKSLRFVAGPWPELLPENAKGREAWVAKRWEILGASHGLLGAALGAAPAGLEPLLSLEGYARTVGMLDLTTKDLARPNPLDARLKAALEASSVPHRSAMARFSLAWSRERRACIEAQEPTSPRESDSEEEEEQTTDLVALSRRVAALPVLPGFDGFGLAPTVALINHSCDCTLDVVPAVYNADVVVTAYRDIAAGEELSMTYIDDTKPRAARQRLLLSCYGFHCRCRRCEAEKDSA